MKTNEQIQEDIYNELKWDPAVNSNEIGVIVRDKGVVTLSGVVPYYSDKIAAEKAATRVSGVKIIAEDIKVSPVGKDAQDDTKIAQAIAKMFEYNTWVPDSVKAKVENGWVTLTGKVDWEYQKSSAKKAIRYLSGVKGITNSIFVKPRVKAGAVRDEIKAAFERLVDIDANNIKIKASGGKVTLLGEVHSFAEKSEARAAAWRTPGVVEVDNQLRVHG